ncbi:hypothetical protein ING2D1G_0686 [Peptoniphilus sp. ING2-D1G]|nr:hypothetical protein ING2D1G_0686 [Peptoniphilus sp. ING2-D1G]
MILLNTTLKKTFYRVIDGDRKFYIEKTTSGYIQLDGNENYFKDRTRDEIKFTSLSNFAYHKDIEECYYEVEIIELDENYTSNEEIINFINRYRRNGRLKKYAYAL